MASTGRAPYNFAPLTEKFAIRYQSPDDLPRHDIWESDLLSGSIDISITAETPMCVSNGEKEGDFYKNPNGEYTIPGSSLRGMVRTNMQILGFAQLRAGFDYDDRTFLYRGIAGAGLKQPERKYYKKALDIQTEEIKTKDKKPKRVSTARRAHAGYLHCEKDKDGKDIYYIRPCKSPYLKPKRNDWDKWKEKYAFSQDIYYRETASKVELSEQKQAGWKHGCLLSPGYMKGQNLLYVFPEEDQTQKIGIDSERIVNYQADFKARENGLKGTEDKHPMDSDFWKLPEAGKCKPVFYLEEPLAFGMSQFLRIFYKHPLSYGIEPDRSTDMLKLDYPNAILGFAEPSKDKDDRDDKGKQYRSRVSFGDCKAAPETQTADKVEMVLGSPKLSFFPNYTVDGKDYNQDDFQMRGIKQYWLKPAEIPPVSSKQKNTSSFIAPVKKGTRFTGTITYRNLHKDELGLLLWCLCLEDGCFQQLGKAKPYGYGCVKLEITALNEYDDPKALYQTLTYTKPQKDKEQLEKRVQELISKYHEKVGDLADIKSDIRKMGCIKDFLYMKQFHESETAFSYLELDEHTKIEKAMPTVQDFRKEQQAKEKEKKKRQKEAEKSSIDSSNPFAKLLDRYN